MCLAEGNIFRQNSCMFRQELVFYSVGDVGVTTLVRRYLLESCEVDYGRDKDCSGG